MEGPHIRLDVDREFSPKPEDGGFGEALDFFKNGSKTQGRDAGLAFALAEIDRSEYKKEIISQALYTEGLNWIDIKNLREKPEASRFFGQMMAHWDTPTATGPKTKKDHEAEAAEFAKLLKSS
ncbi:MAG: hypothetical protein A3A96_04420 [Candidatus Zambryskibacteria bacterium RIFCSPLOWO2_01_FULL_39_39]|uniref:Uncharacterized protein n=1 Tax=Candidatus Zambryskibacteria bacterium RIFCSPLOWO2_01_FULL_39_39 TaxID=1802758 RepID=A0A1G2TWU6_9BACT|nr:MAG: hypothetical protein UT00_C0003G0059 [Parcubacteria group bacterium GW2011_GWA1_38_7]OHA87376.1 MAG: hypothetical protein A2644_04100 [Candidatus Zambryskibacteria bacterium RIFCSPHIGHO2_01_FULL_39_63]OHA95341.1 MAG: hypothetical protein A3B88_02585 [Candidatus Zambryskibacteria bacterium RIFCSPHIGHO2_02_FULL_39_19]OHA97981.1 MAG: hypothetical protein A3F20_04375 [Candidatus Zambryskibacteria bacterium RIFCSPHIGHO2_12_FULL_39_21]OHB01771.1 MAG: hypothetical protein A3A96_04420 [Candidat